MAIRKFKFIDLFCGIGGFRIALDQLGMNCVFSSEIDYYARKTYKANFGELPEGDITKIKEQIIPAFDVLCAGFPCQPFSISGKQLGFDDTRGTLFHDIARIAKYHNPKLLFLENVRNLVQHDGGNTLKTIRDKLESIGYDVYHKIVNASMYGVPQARERIYMLGFRKDLEVKDFIFPQSTDENIYLKDILLPESEVQSLYIQRNDIKMYFNYKNLQVQKRLRPVRLGIVNKGGQGERIYSINGHAITLSAYGGGVGAKTGLYLIDNKIRKLHVEECKRIMAFPDNYILCANKNQIYKQFGNAVVVKVIKVIVKEALRVILWKEKSKMQQSEMKSSDYSLVS